MAKPTDRASLLLQGKNNYIKLIELIEEYTPSEQEQLFPDGSLNRNIRDVLCHLHHWHVMMKSWYVVGMKGENPPMPAKGYSWKTLPDLNRWIQKEYEKIPLKLAKELLEASYIEIRMIIKSHSDEELFDKKRYHWTGSTSLGAYFISNTSSHYNWAYKLIKKAMKVKK